MDTPKRTWTKAILWQALGLFSMLVVNALIGLAVYILFERAWNRISWGRVPLKEDME